MKFVVVFPASKEGYYRSGPVSVRPWAEGETNETTPEGALVIDGEDKAALFSLGTLLIVQSEATFATVLEIVIKNKGNFGRFVEENKEA